MEKSQIQRIKGLMETKGVNILMLASECGKNHMTIRRVLQDETYNPTIDTIKAIAEALGVDEQYILNGKEFSPKDYQGVKGYIDYNGKITRVDTFKQLQAIYESIKTDLETPNEAKDLIKQDKANKKTQSQEPLDIKTINLFQSEHYDTSKVATWDFRKSEDEREEMLNNLGNMCKGYEFDISSVHFLNSEAAYICGLFSNNTKEHIDIQKELIAEPNGYSTKKVIRRKYEFLGRKDWETYNVQWMIYVVWQKVRQNKAFSALLKRIPDNCIIVENSTHQKAKKGEKDTSMFWGAKNFELEQNRDIIEKNEEIKNLGKKKKDISRLKMTARNSILNFGVWDGVNCMGKILTICKHCLENGIEPPIDYELLKSKNIYLLGELLTFDDSHLHQPKKRAKSKVAISNETKAPLKSTDGKVKGIIGAVIGEIVGSRFEFAKSLPKRYELFANQCSFTDDTVLTIAIADSLLHNKEFQDTLWTWGKKYPHAGYGRSFKEWLNRKKKDENATNDSMGNGCGMRVSPIGFYAKTFEETLELAKQSAIITHNSKEGVRGAQSIAAATYLAKEQRPKDEIRAYIEKTFGYNLQLTDEEIIDNISKLDGGERMLAENTCPLAIIAFLVTDDYESAIRKAISYHCDTDTVACMTGGIAAAYYGVPQAIINEVADYLPQEIIDIINEFDGIHIENTRTTPKDSHRWGDIYVYGSGDNKNGETEAFIASKYFGASKVIEGIEKRAYAIPVVGRSLNEIKLAVERFIEYAETHQDKTFLVTEIGCSKAGYTPKDIAPMFEKAKAMRNVYLPMVFKNVPTIWEKRKKKSKIDDRNS